ncbi:MAG: hypothetical protein AVDCRST_MAG85-1119 [uncultured Solirubrobacteraceae bacterium]|uniref:Uncharacterized protein n=1 Tax=uncultured Solirubrobacteraceae bacterium TaxID=1162706 RepID=A0A6J4S3P6_9ACTN|nr:MAG: hypothetical protein AVDCRST_MAG85-1119 [uncultured Solirubrobacteraceae bacterium]
MTAATALTIVLAGAAAAAPASAAAPKLGIYDCEGIDTFDYVNSVKLMSGGRYLVGSERVGSKLKRTTKGRYKVTGKKITWLSGMYKRGGYSSTVYKTYFTIDRLDGTSTGVSCTFLPKPTGARAPGI